MDATDNKSNDRHSNSAGSNDVNFSMYTFSVEFSSHLLPFYLSVSCSLLGTRISSTVVGSYVLPIFHAKFCSYLYISDRQLANIECVFSLFSWSFDVWLDFSYKVFPVVSNSNFVTKNKIRLLPKNVKINE